MAQKIHPRNMRSNLMHAQVYERADSLRTYSADTKNYLLALDLLKRFYSGKGYTVTNPIFSQRRKNLYVTYELNSSVIIDLRKHISAGSMQLPTIKKKKKRRTSKSITTNSSRQRKTSSSTTVTLPSFFREPFTLSPLIGKASPLSVQLESSDRRQDLWTQSKLEMFRYRPSTARKPFIWSTEINILARVFFRIMKCYPFFIKNNLFQQTLNFQSPLNSETICSHLQDQLQLAEKRRQKINIKAYMDNLVQEPWVHQLLQGIKVQIKGRYSLGGSGNKGGRSKKDLSAWGNIPLQTVTSFVDYHYLPVKTQLGVCGIKVWTHHRI